MKYLFLRPYLEKKTWAGSRINSIFNCEEHVGEAWIISGYKNKSSVITNKNYLNIHLDNFYNTHRDFFDNHLSNEYPLLTKILDCGENLSVQVHPSNSYAKKHNVPTKNEAWYFLDCDPNTSIVYGHNAKTLNNFKKKVNENDFKNLLRYKKVFPGSLINVPTGTIHGLSKSCLVFEIQQPSDITYRLFDYDRNQINRPLHINECIENTTIPFIDTNINTISKHLETPFFTIHILENKHIKKYSFEEAKWIQVYIVDGQGKLDFNKKIKKGDIFIINANSKSFWMRGNISFIVTYIKK